MNTPPTALTDTVKQQRGRAEFTKRLVLRMNQFFDRVESQLRQSLRAAAENDGTPTPTVDARTL